MNEQDFIELIEAFYKDNKSGASSILEKIILQLKMVGNDRFADQIRTIISNNTIITTNDFNDRNLLDLIDSGILRLFSLRESTQSSTFGKSGQKKFEKHHICELEMHKMLYLLYCRFYEKFKKPLFNANFVAGAFSPIELDYLQWLKTADSESWKLIAKFRQLPINQNEIAFLETEIDNLLQHSSTELSEMAKAQENKWIKSTNKGQTL